MAFCINYTNCRFVEQEKKVIIMSSQEVSLTYTDYVKGIQSLTLEEQLTLIEIISANVKRAMRQTEKTSVSKLAKLKKRHLINGDPEELVDLKVWEWNEQQNL
jgi:hypothetical protein